MLKSNFPFPNRDLNNCKLSRKNCLSTDLNLIICFDFPNSVVPQVAHHGPKEQV